MAKTLHITNGQILTDYLTELEIEGDYLTWHEMLCEGPTIAHIDSDEFISVRKNFLKEFYNIELDEERFKSELGKLNQVDKYDEIVMWFEYDLFCHINLLGAMSLIHQREIKLRLHLVCSGWVDGQTELKALSELSKNQLLYHYKNKIEMTDKDRDLAISLWRIYCGKDHNLFKPYIIQESSFEYLSNCLKAHLKRFPDSKSGLSVIESNILSIVKSKNVKSFNHLLGYIMNYQGYYGFGDIQLRRKIDNLKMFIVEDDTGLKLNRLGHEALIGSHNFASKISNKVFYGGVSSLDFQFNIEQNKLIKTAKDAN